MAYVKLDTGLLDSTLWVDRESREVFITSLLMALPYEVVEPLAQIEVRTLDFTGWKIPVGWYGKVEAAGSGIVRRALVDIEPGLAALERLGNPDPESRSHKYDGRRLVRVDGGFIVLNFMDYRDRDNTSAVRQQRYRERQKLRKLNQVTRDGVDVTRNCDTAVSSKQEAVSSKATTTTLVPYPADFEIAWKAFPGKAGGNPKGEAYAQYKARVKEGAATESLLSGVQRYAAYIRATGDEGTKFVQMGKTFFGKGRHWEEPWTLPITPKKLTEQDRNTAVLDNWLAQKEAQNG